MKTITNNVDNIDEVKQQVNEALDRKMESNIKFIDQTLVIRAMTENTNIDYWTINQIIERLWNDYSVNVSIKSLKNILNMLIFQGIVDVEDIEDKEYYGVIRNDITWKKIKSASIL
ncbi:hypothetical protein D1872_198330 [compost metagenome]